MPAINLMEAAQAERKARLVAGALSDFLANFNAAFPDPEAESIALHFDYFTEEYVAQTCATVLAEHVVVAPMTERRRVPTESEFDFSELSEIIDSIGFAEDRDVSEARALESESER